MRRGFEADVAATRRPWSFWRYFQSTNYQNCLRQCHNSNGHRRSPRLNLLCYRATTLPSKSRLTSTDFPSLTAVPRQTTNVESLIGLSCQVKTRDTQRGFDEGRIGGWGMGQRPSVTINNSRLRYLVPENQRSAKRSRRPSALAPHAGGGRS